MLYPQLQGFLAKRKEKTQQFPQQQAFQPSYPGQQPAPLSQEDYNEQQADLNRGMIGGKFNRRSF